MKKNHLFAWGLAVTLCACNNPNNPRTEDRNISETENYDTQTQTDNTNTSTTPVNDRDITNQIRKALYANDALSANAKNIKISSINGVVTISGMVANSQERNTIQKMIKSIAGVKRVDNQLDIPNPNSNSY